MNAASNTRSLYLELCALGVDMSTGDIDAPVVKAVASPSHAELLLARVRSAREELRALIVGQGDKDLDAIREEGRA